jgi:hypothetical protein
LKRIFPRQQASARRLIRSNILEIDNDMPDDDEVGATEEDDADAASDTTNDAGSSSRRKDADE